MDSVCCWVEAVDDVAGHRDIEVVVEFLGKRWFVASGQRADVNDEQRYASTFGVFGGGPAKSLS